MNEAAPNRFYQGIQKTSPPDWAVRTLADQKWIDSGGLWIEDEAQVIKQFFENYCVQKQHKWKGTLPTLLDFQYRDIIAPLYSWYYPDGKMLRADKLIAMGPKSWGKSFISSALCLYHCLREPFSHCMIFASGERQARIIFEHIKGFRQHPDLFDRLHVKNAEGIIVDKEGESTIEVAANNAENKSGYALSFQAYDELAEWADGPSREIHAALKYAGIRSTNAITTILSNPTANLSGLGKEMWDVAKAIIDGTDLTTSIIPVIYGADMADDPSDPAVWRKAHPAFGVLVDERYYQRAWDEAQNSPRGIADFKTKLLGTWVGSLTSAIPMQDFMACKENFTEDELSEWSLNNPGKCILSADWGGNYDFCAWCILFWKDEKLYCLPRCALPENVLQKKIKTEHSSYYSWATSGHIKIDRGQDTIQRSTLKQWWQEDIDRFNPYMAAIDDYNLGDMREWLEVEKGIPVICVRTNQYNEIGPLSLQFEKLIRDKQFRHNNQNPLFAWQMECLQWKPNPSNPHQFRPDKSANGKNKIDIPISCIVGMQALPELQSTGCGIW